MMIQAILTPQSDGSLLIEHPDIWEKKNASCQRKFTANVRGRRIEVYVGMLDSKYNVVKIPLYYFNSWRDAEDFDERPGQNVIASSTADCIKWIKAYTPPGPEKDRLLEFFSWLHLTTYMELRRPIWEKESAQWEEDRRIETATWYAREEARMNAEAASLEEVVGPSNFTVESEDRQL
jgi:hypothetical protein